MKGILISIIVFVVYVIYTIIVAHFGKIKRYGRLFFPAVALWSPLYFLLYFMTPRNVWILPDTWLGEPEWLEITYGYVIYLLNCHSYIDFFFGFTGGFSTSLLREILLSGAHGRTTDEIAAGFQTTGGEDKIYQRRIPHLAESGMITVSGGNQMCRATAKGKRWAVILSFAKRTLNLDKGG